MPLFILNLWYFIYYVISSLVSAFDSNKAMDNCRPRRTIRKPVHYRDFV